MKKFLIILIAAILLAACGGRPAITAGKITGKDHGPARFWIQTVLMTVEGQTVMIPFFHSTPEYWALELKNDGENGRIYVPKETFDRVSVGDYYRAAAGDSATLADETHPASEEEKRQYGTPSSS